jgi:hypothetical protein
MSVRNHHPLATLAGLSELFQTSKQNIAKHLKAIFAETDLAPDDLL